MKRYQQKIKLLKKYASQISTEFEFYVGEDIPYKKLSNAIKRYANGLNRKSVIGLYDTTVTGSGKRGYIFTDTKICYLQTLDKPKKLWYEDISSFKWSKYDNSIIFNLADGTMIEWRDSFLNVEALASFFEELFKISDNNIVKNDNNSLCIKKEKEVLSVGIALESYRQVNKLFDEEKFHAIRGHGFAAERANTLYDKFTGHDARVVGDNNIKNGADRLLDGVKIQSKYCKTGSRCVSECFDKNGDFRYIQKGKPMKIEVPSDKFDAAVKAMEDKIRKGKVPGITDQNEAKNIIRKGHFTYEQAKNIAKSGTVESLTYDAVNGAVIATSAFGVTAIITMACNIWNGEEVNDSIKRAIYSGVKVGGTAFLTTIITGQLYKAGLNCMLVEGTEAIVSSLGSKQAATLVNAFRNGSNIYGTAAMKSASKLLRGNIITAGVTIGVLSSFDVANMFRGKISSKQLFKNITNTSATVSSGIGGWIGGAVIGSTIVPGAGAIVGGVVGSITTGTIASKATDSIIGKFIEDDAETMVCILQQEMAEISNKYLLSEKEAEKVIDKLKDVLTSNRLMDMYSCDDKIKYAHNLLIPIVKDEINKRKYIHAIQWEELEGFLNETEFI